MKATFLAVAALELEDAVDFYNSRRDGLGDEFREQVTTAIAELIEFPTRYPHLD